MKRCMGKVFVVFMVFAMVFGFIPFDAMMPEWAKWMQTDVVSSNVAQAAETASGYGSNGKFLAPIEPPVAGSIPISDRAGLEAIANNLSGNYHLTQNIDLSGVEWVPIGTTSAPFTGCFDGQGYVISNMKITGNQAGYYGLFGYTAASGREATFSNIGLEATDIAITDLVSGVYGEVYVGSVYGACASFSPSVTNCYSAGSVVVSMASFSGSDTFYTVFIGGIFGANTSPNNQSTTNKCYNLASITAVAKDARVGGICSQQGAYSSISDCHNEGALSASSYAAAWASYSGGITGIAEGKISNCYNTGSVLSIADSNGAFAGGISGNSSQATISGCYNTGDISAHHTLNSGAYAGGISGGLAFGLVENCYNSGSISATAACDASWHQGAGVIIGTHPTARAGGIGGSMSSGRIRYSYNIGAVATAASCPDYPAESDAGGVCGEQYLNSYIFCDDSYCLELYASALGVQLTEMQMKMADSFTGFDFIDIWDISSTANGGYPYLRYFGVDDTEDVDVGVLTIASVITPPGAIISHEPNPNISVNNRSIDGTITATVDSTITSQPIRIVPSIGDATWTLHRINNKTSVYEKLEGEILPLSVGENHAFIELSASGFDKVVYFVTITRKAPSLSKKTIFFNEDFKYPSGSAYEAGKVEVYWGESLFSESALIANSSDLNWDLALVAAALNAAADGDAKKLPAAYKELDFAAENIKYYNYDYHSPFTSENVGPYGTNQFCFSIATQEMVIDGAKQLVIIVILRGTGGIQEISGDVFAKAEQSVNINGTQIKVYDYFLEFADQVKETLDNRIKESGIKEFVDKGSVKLLIGGHSLGGAAANLLAMRLEQTNKISQENIYAYTFGALNTIGYNTNSQDSLDRIKNCHLNIMNFFNHYDTYGPYGDGTYNPFLGTREKPAHGKYTYNNKFGWRWLFTDTDFKDVFVSGNTSLANHVMACYVDLVREQTDPPVGTRISILCPVDVDIYDSTNQLLGRFKNNIVDQSVTSIPIYVDNDEKYIFLPAGTEYTLEFTAYGDGIMEYHLETANEQNGAGFLRQAFTNVSLTPGKKMYSVVGGNVDVPDTRLYIVDNNGNMVAEVLTDGTEVPFITVTAAAIISDTTISGSVGSLLGGGQTATVTVAGDSIAVNLDNTDASNWFTEMSNRSTQTHSIEIPDPWPLSISSASASGIATGLPKGITAKASTTAGSNTVQLTFGGTPTVTSNDLLYVTIPGGVLSSGNDLAAASNPNARFNIIDQRPLSELPKTGDGFPLGTLLALLGMALAALGWLGLKMRFTKAKL